MENKQIIQWAGQNYTAAVDEGGVTVWTPTGNVLFWLADTPLDTRWLKRCITAFEMGRLEGLNGEKAS